MSSFQTFGLVINGTDLSSSGGAGLVGYKNGFSGSVLRTQQSKNQEWVSVLDAGADPTAAADSTNAFNVAITFASLTNKCVLAPDGNYLINGTVQLLKNVSLQGKGKYCTQIYFGTSGTFTATGTVGTPTGNFHIKDMGLTNQGTGSPTALALTYTNNLLVDNCIIYNISVSLSGFQYVAFDRCDFYGCTFTAGNPVANGISQTLKVLSANCSGSSFVVSSTADVYFSDVGMLGPASQIAISQGSNPTNFYPPVFLQNVVVDSGAGVGVALTGVVPHLRGLFVSCGRTNSLSGITMNNCVDGSLVDVQSRYNGQHGLYMDSCNNISVSACAFNDNKAYGVRIGNCDRIRFVGNSMRNDPTWYGGNYVQTTGIADDPSNSTNITFIGNDVSGNSSTSAYLPSNTNTILGNVGYGAKNYASTPMLVSALPAPATAGVGARAFVTDSTTLSYGATPTGGGGISTPVYCNGTGWFVG
jgi:hypothetical protein